MHHLVSIVSEHPLILPEDIRRKATAPSKKPRRTLIRNLASPSALLDLEQGELPSLPCWRSTLASAAAKAAVAAATRASWPARKWPRAPFPSRKVPGFP